MTLLFYTFKFCSFVTRSGNNLLQILNMNQFLFITSRKHFHLCMFLHLLNYPLYCDFSTLPLKYPCPLGDLKEQTKSKKTQPKLPAISQCSFAQSLNELTQSQQRICIIVDQSSLNPATEIQIGPKFHVGPLQIFALNVHLMAKQNREMTDVDYDHARNVHTTCLENNL